MKPDEHMPTSTALIISAAFAIVFLVLFMWVGGFGFFGALLLGLLIGIVVFVILIMLFTGSDSSSGAGAAAPHAKPDRAAPKPAAGAAPQPAPKPGAAAEKSEPKPKAKPATSTAGAAATAPTDETPDATKPGAGAAKGAGAPAPKPAAKGAASVEAQPGGKAPGALQSPRDGGADNLKEIKGVGPKLEQMLHDMGVYHFDQIAAWGPSEVAWADENLKGFKGRVSRDDWVGQAKILAAGGETEFSKKVDKGGMY